MRRSGERFAIGGSRRTREPPDLRTTASWRYRGSSGNPSSRAFWRMRSSSVSTDNPGTAARAESALAKCSASSVRIGSTGKGCRARSTTSECRRSMCHPAAAADRCPRLLAASASLRDSVCTDRSRARSHSKTVRSEATTRSAPSRALRIASPDFSPSNQASTALDSAYNVTGRRAQRQAVHAMWVPSLNEGASDTEPWTWPCRPARAVPAGPALPGRSAPRRLPESWVRSIRPRLSPDQSRAPARQSGRFARTRSNGSLAHGFRRSSLLECSLM